MSAETRRAPLSAAAHRTLTRLACSCCDTALLCRNAHTAHPARCARRAGKKYDPEGAYIRRFVPVLAALPAKYIYEPWTAPLEVQQR